jgi:hypothetical protein
MEFNCIVLDFAGDTVLKISKTKLDTALDPCPTLGSALKPSLPLKRWKRRVAPTPRRLPKNGLSLAACSIHLPIEKEKPDQVARKGA